MGLSVVEGALGQWLGDEWAPGTPGLFAVVIGVSEYLHLEGGVAPAPQTYGLGQLSVSALTAWRVFEWLRDSYRVDGCPPARVWLLLAPTPQEVVFEPALDQHRLAAAIDHCELAIGQWHAAMRALPQAAAEQSRALFFFSGHGLKVHLDSQILLPTDYLRPPTRNVNLALSTDNLVAGLASLAVPKQFFFLDACRDDNQQLRDMRISGRPVLNEDVTVRANNVAPVLYATASGQRAFQQPDPKKGLSLFGTALLDGLAGKPEMKLLLAGAQSSVNIYPLQGYVMSRVVELLEKAEEQVSQSVSLGGRNLDNVDITFLPLPVTPAAVASAAPSALQRVSQIPENIRPGQAV